MLKTLQKRRCINLDEETVFLNITQERVIGVCKVHLYAQIIELSHIGDLSYIQFPQIKMFVISMAFGVSNTTFYCNVPLFECEYVFAL